MGGLAYAQESLNQKVKPPTTSIPSQPSNKSAKEKRIIILGTTIVGSLVKPRTVYEVPWKEPESLKKGLDTPQRSFQDEIFMPIDKERFESQMGPQ
jgi:hypothetical protein